MKSLAIMTDFIAKAHVADEIDFWKTQLPEGKQMKKAEQAIPR